ncbi:MAG: hypothetical protein JNL38_29080 [Myxococcales bacterium]|nr:hypothetical protein [Myxococcales bacterium]
MPTLLTTRRMDPALRERVAASVRGERAAGGRGLSPRAVVAVRVLVVLAVVGAFATLGLARRRDAARFDQDRAAVVASVQAARAGLGDDERAAVARAHAALAPLALSYPGDDISPEIRAPGALDRWLARPALWVRGPASAFASSEGISRAAATPRDPTVLCLLDPPASRAEKSVLGKVRATYAPGVLEERAAHVRRLGEAEHALAVLSPAFEAKVLAADSDRALALRRAELDPLPLARGRAALRATVAIGVADEEGAPGGPTELDGERPHDVRFVLVDLERGRTLVRLRRRVDPSVWSQAARAEHASGMDACALAMDVRAAVAAAPR